MLRTSSAAPPKNSVFALRPVGGRGIDDIKVIQDRILQQI